jgi:integrase
VPPVAVNDLWHKRHPKPGEKRCGAHRLVPTAAHGKGKRYQVRVTDPDGNPLARESYATQKEADDRDAELKVAAKTGTVVDDKGGKTLFEAYARGWLKTRRHDHGTAERVLSQLVNHCFEDPETKGLAPSGGQAIGQRSMGTLARRASVMRDWAADLKLEANTAILLLGIVTAIFDAAVDDMIVPRNPLRTGSFDKPKRTKTDLTVWTAEEIEAACERLPAELKALGWLGAVTGGRQGELLGVQKDDFDFLRKTVTYSVQVVYIGGRMVFKPLKNDKPRTVPIATPVIPVLSEHMRKYPPVAVTLPWSEKGSKQDGKPHTRMLVFTDGGRAYYRQTANRHWRKAWTAAGIEDRGRANGMHILRHSVAARWMSKGLNPSKVAAYLGDTVAVVIEFYSHWLPEDDDLGRAIVDDYVTPGKTAPKTSDRHRSDMAAV